MWPEEKNLNLARDQKSLATPGVKIKLLINHAKAFETKFSKSK